MGTRNLTMVQKDGKIKVAQYGQWDGYPEGQGTTVYEFIKNANMDKFRKQIDKVKKVVLDENAPFSKRLDRIFNRVQTEERKLYDIPGLKYETIRNRKLKVLSPNEQLIYKLFTRDTCADILNVILKADAKEILHFPEIEFAGDSLFCEWAYLLNLDTNELEVYSGFNLKPLKPFDRFHNLSTREPVADVPKYYPIKLIKKYKFNRMPKTVENYVKALKAAQRKMEREQKNDNS